jgi:hypothetical protein
MTFIVELIFLTVYKRDGVNSNKYHKIMKAMV